MILYKFALLGYGKTLEYGYKRKNRRIAIFMLPSLALSFSLYILLYTRIYLLRESTTLKKVDMLLINNKTQADDGTEPSRQSFVTRVYALFAAHLLLTILFSTVYMFNAKLLTWVINHGIWIGHAVFAIAVIATFFLGQLISLRRKENLVKSVLSVFITHGLALRAAVDKSGLVQRMPIDFFVVLVALTICSKYWPSIVHNISHYAMSSLVALPVLTVLLILLQFESLQLEVVRLVADIVLVLLITFYTSAVVEKHTSEPMFVVAVNLFYNVMLRIALVMICVLVVVSRFAS